MSGLVCEPDYFTNSKLSRILVKSGIPIGEMNVLNTKRREQVNK